MNAAISGMFSVARTIISGVSRLSVCMSSRKACSYFLVYSPTVTPCLAALRMILSSTSVMFITCFSL